MKIQIGKIVESKTALNELVNMKLPIATAFKVGVIAKRIEPELAVFEASRLKLCEEYGKFNKKTGNFDLGKNTEKFATEYKSLCETEIDLDCLKLSIADFREDSEISGAILFTLDWLIDLEGKAAI